MFQTGAFCKLYALRSLQISTYEKVKNFNIPKLLLKNNGLKNLEVHVDTDTSLDKEMEGVLPYKVRNLTFSGLKLKKIADDLLDVGFVFI